MLATTVFIIGLIEVCGVCIAIRRRSKFAMSRHGPRNRSR